MAVDFHTGVTPNRPVSELADLAAHAEDLGMTGVWLADSQTVFRDVYVAMALCAARTTNVLLGPAVSNIVTRHPSVLAGTMATLAELTGGRVALGLGVGGSATRTAGLRQSRLADLEEAISAIRAMLAGEVGRYRGIELKMSWAAQPVPIYIAASNPKSLQLAGRVADGVQVLAGTHPAFVAAAIDNVLLGVEQAGRKRPDIRVYVRFACGLSPNGETAREEAKAYGAVAANTLARNALLASLPEGSLPEELTADLDRLRREFDYHEHGRRAADHTRYVTNRILDFVAIAGTPDDAIPRFQELAELDIDGFLVPGRVRDPRELLRLLAAEVAPNIE